MNRIQDVNDSLRFAGPSQLQSHPDIAREIFDPTLNIGRVQEQRAAANHGALSPLYIIEMII
jgi:hypothetical protein